MKEKLLLLFLAAATAFGSSMIVASNADVLMSDHEGREESSRVLATKTPSPEPEALRSLQRPGFDHVSTTPSNWTAESGDVDHAIFAEEDTEGNEDDQSSLYDEEDCVHAASVQKSLQEVLHGTVASMTPLEFEKRIAAALKRANSHRIGAMTPATIRKMIANVVAEVLAEGGTVGSMNQDVLKAMICDVFAAEMQAREEATTSAAKEKTSAVAKKEADYRAAHPWKARASDCKNKVVCCCKRVPVAVQTAVVVIVTQVAMRMAGF